MNNRHTRRALGMQRHYSPPHVGGSIDAQRTANPNPEPTDFPGQGKPQPVTYQGHLPVGGRGGDRQQQ